MRKTLEWIGSTKRDILKLPKEIREDFGYALYLAECGDKSPHAKLFSNVGGGVFEIVENFDGNTYRAMYTVRFKEAIYVLHVFQKKSKKGIATPQADVEMVRRRFQIAKELHDAYEKSGEN
jgi:phage-related protein